MADDAFAVELWDSYVASGNDAPNARLFSFALPSSIADGSDQNTFTAPAGNILFPETTYFIVIRETTSFDVSFNVTNTNDEEASDSGWSINDNLIEDQSAGESQWSPSGTPSEEMLIGIFGEARTSALPNAAPLFTLGSNFIVDENQTSAGTVRAMDDDPVDNITGYAITGGEDQSFLSIGETSGALTFDEAPNYEEPKDQDTDNVYKVRVQATSGTGMRVMTNTAAFSVAVRNVGGEAPDAPDAPDVSTASVTGLTVTWSAPSNPGPAITHYDVQYRAGTSGDWSDGNHIGTATTATLAGLSENTSYQVQVRATNEDGTGPWSDSGTGTTDANAAPSFTSSAFEAAENQTSAGTVVAMDSDGEDEITGYEITGGADRSFFSIRETSGALTFRTAPNFEAPSDDDTDNDYKVRVEATSGTGEREKTATRTITVTVTDVRGEAPGAPRAPNVSAASATSLTVTWSAPENEGPAITDYDVQYREGTSGGWTDGNHNGSARTATLTGLSENTRYQVQVRANNAEGTGAWSDSGSGMTEANATPLFDISATTFRVAENATSVGTVRATDSDSEDAVTGYAITGGADQSFFSIGATSGVLTFDAPPNFEDPKDQGNDNTYMVEVTATSGEGERERTATQTITVTVTDDKNEVRSSPARRNPQPLQLALWTERPGYRAGDTVRLYLTLDPHDDRGRYLARAYLEPAAGDGPRRYLAALPGPGSLREEPADLRGRPLASAPTRSLPRAEKTLAWEGPAPEPGLWQFVLVLEPGPDGEFGDEPAERPRTRRAWAKFTVAGGSQLLNRRGFDREIREDLALRADTLYYLGHQLFVHDGATLSIEPGTVVLAWGRNTAIVVERGGKIVAEGTREAPVVLTCSQPTGRRQPGCWGGLRLLGKAPVTRLEGLAHGVLPAERPAYGGSSPDDSSGTLRHVRVEFAGAGAEPGTFAPALGLYGAGAGTVLEHVQARSSLGDGIAFSGGTAACDFCVASGSGEAGLAWERGWQGAARHLFVFHGPEGYDGLRGGNDAEGHDLQPRSAPALASVTLIHASPYGRRARQATGLRLETGSAVTAADLLVTRFGGGAIAASSRSALLFAEGESGVSSALLHRNGHRPRQGQLRGNIAAGVDFTDRDPKLRDTRLFANPDPRPKASSPALKKDRDAQPAYVGAFGRDLNWLEEWTVFGPEEDYDPREADGSQQ